MLLPLVYRCRAMGCVYLLAPWDIHAELGKAALQEMAALLASGGSQWGGGVQLEDVFGQGMLCARAVAALRCVLMALPADTRQRCE